MLSAALAEKLRGRRLTQTASLSLLLALLSGYGAILYFDVDGEHQSILESGLSARSLQEKDAADSKAAAEEDATRILTEDESSRLLAKNGDSPPSSDEVPGQYIIKPWVGQAMEDVWEDRADTKVALHSAQASNVQNGSYLPKYAIDDPNLSSRWSSSLQFPKDEEWLNIDMGGPNTVEEVYIKWHETAYAVDYKLYVAYERTNCRNDGSSCPAYWIHVATETGKSNADPTTHAISLAPQGVRYVRIAMTKRATGQTNFSIYYARIYRKKRIIGETPIAGVTCGATTAAAASSLLGTYGGSLMQTYDTAEFFLASMTEAQKDAMFEDQCVFTVEPNYIVRARGSSGTKKRLGWGNKNRDSDATVEEEGHQQRNLAIPEFNLKDENPPNWMLQRVSSHGKLNGKYIWFHEGTGIDLYMFDTAIYPDHDEWKDRNDATRLMEPTICAGTATDYTTTDHGTHAAAIAAGYTHGTGKGATIHPIQVLDADGEGTTATVLCGLEKLLQDGIAYNAANTPHKHRAAVNLSLGTEGRSDALDKATQDMTAAGYVVTIAAGNNDDNACFYSPHAENALTIGALTYHELGMNSKVPSSNFGACIDFWAPGEDLLAASNAGEFETVNKSGTSVASAVVAGIATLFLEELATEDMTLPEIPDKVHDRMVNKAEVNIMVDYGQGSPNKIVQTTAVRCLVNAHCQTGLTCIRDGTCVDLSKPLK